MNKNISKKIEYIYMEEQMNINQNNNQIANKKVKVRASEIIQRFKSIQDRQALCKENSKHIF